jgi:hypothetical protein
MAGVPGETMMLRTKIPFLATLIGVLFAGTASIVQAQEAVSGVGERIASFEMSWRELAPLTVADRLLGAAEVMLQRPVERDRTREPLASALAGPERGGWIRLEIAPQLLVRYMPEVGEMRLLNEELTVIGEPREEISGSQVVQLAGRYLEQLSARNVLNTRFYKIENAEIGYRREGAGTIGGPRDFEQISEYRITIRPEINGVEVANAGVRMGILPTGELVSLRFGGATLPRGEDVGGGAGEPGEGFITPQGAGKVLERKVPAEAIRAQFYRGLPQGVAAQVHWERVMYVMPEGQEQAVVEPLYVISYSEMREVDGVPVISRRKTVGFSLTKPEAGPVDLSPVTQRDIQQGQRVERKAVEE